MKTILMAALAVVLLLIGATCPAADFQITKIVDIGPVSLSVDLGPLKFSPEGDKLGYFLGTAFMISDTLGVSREVIQLDMRPLLFEWLSNDEILVLEYKSLGQASDYRRLSRLDVNNGFMETIHEHSRFPKGKTSGTAPIKGLIRTVEGHTGYALVKPWRQQELKFPESQYDNTAHTKALANDHILVWGDSGLYKLSTNLTDSVRIGPKFTVLKYTPPIFNSDLSYVMARSKIYRVSDSTFIDMVPKFKIPEGLIACESYWSVINPVLSEILFDRLCYGVDSSGADIETDKLGLFEIKSGKITYLDPLVGMDNCRAPAYAPDGKKIAFSANGNGYIIYREWENGELKR